ncbi:TonB-dependent receptor [Tamlana fucoidanivorans]|uniref:TonB-dependent receptor n=1 Tax=Allotamlana fucoidanivorans TaxID=2583814 RepID=A0A5C4SP19_9FLAO|nr:TonB-dependent receptor [Tamlana fucoidanivorans]TNJ46024.1 TonB-dependent receptor [Tamlana fucoidanivorans]
MKKAKLIKEYDVSIFLERIKFVLFLMLFFLSASHQVLAKNLTDDKKETKLIELFNEAQNVVSGIVKDKNGQPLPGANVFLKGTTNGVVTDFDGLFQLNVSGKNPILVVSFIGFKTSEVPVAGKSQIEIILQEDAQNLDEVVVVGYGSVKKKDLTGSIGSVEVDELNVAPVGSFDDALAGRVSGVQVSSTQGRPGAPSNIVIRGTGSLTQSSAPLYVVDGFPIGDFDPSSIDQSDIESMQILKGPSAVSIYGARGGNGVILITTKGGVKGKTRITYDEFYGVENITKRIDVMSPYDYVDLRYEIDPIIAEERYGDLENYRNVEPIDWQGETFRQTEVSSRTLSASGGTDGSNYNIALSRYEGEGLLENSGFSRTYAKVKFDQKMSDKVKIGTNISYTSTVVDGTHTSTNILDPTVEGGSSNARFNLLKDIVQGRPTGGIQYSNEEMLNLPEDPETEEGAPITNPLVNARTQIRKDVRNVLLFNGYFDYEITKGLRFRTSGGIQKQIRRRESFDQKNSAWERRNGFTRGFITISERLNALVSSTLNYRKTFGDKNYVTGLLGFDYQNITDKSVTANGANFPEPNLGVDDLGAGTTPGFSSSFRAPTNRLISVFARATYTYDDKYLFTGTVRRDGSSRFGENQKFGTFPSFSVAWRFDQESFVKSFKSLSNGKLRFEWGQVGNNRIPAFVSTSLLNSVTYGAENGTVPGVRPANLANPDIRWEAQEQINLGIDLGFFNNKLSLTADVFRKTSKDLLLETPVPGSTGFTEVFSNAGKIQNEGLEIAINSVNFNKKFKWNTNLNITFPNAKTLALVESDTLLSNSGWRTNNPSVDPYSQDFITTVGQPFGLMYGYIDDGLYREEDFDANGDPFIDVAFGNEELGFRKYVDVNDDGVINEDDKVVIGNPNPKFFGGLTNNFAYKGFDLSIFLQWSYGNDIYNANRILWTSDLQAVRNFIPEVVNRWRDSNTPEQNRGATFRNARDLSAALTTQYIEDGSFLRLKTVSLGYSMPKKVLEKIKLQKLRLYITGQNLITWTNYSGYDPEVSTRGNGLTSGVDFGAYPRSKTYVLGISLGI